MRQGGSREEVADRSAKGDISEGLFCASHCVPCDAGYTGDKGRGWGGVGVYTGAWKTPRVWWGGGGSGGTHVSQPVFGVYPVLSLVSR